MYRNGLSELLSTLQITIGLTLGHRPLASQAFGSLGKWRMLAEEGASLIEPVGFLSIAGASHMTYKYVHLCHKSRGFSCSFTLLPVANCALKLEVIFCVQAVITPPCGVPSSTGLTNPFSITPAFKNTRMSFSTRLSVTRFAT